jgi:lysine decarboxylase
MELVILKAINDYKEKNPKRFHMPGHKGDKKFNKMFRQAQIDITELAFSDNLDNPSGIIEKAEEDIAEILEAKKSFILTGGSSSGIFAMLKAVKPLGSKIIICRNSHRSVYNACEILGLEPYVLNHNYKHGIVLPPSLEEIETLLKRDNEIIGVLLTSPDYFGNVIELDKIKEITKQYNKVLLVDEAHGSHLKFLEDDNLYAGKYADIWVDGLHKTMPCLTQGAVLSTNNTRFIESLKESLKYFRTTSPSYPIMASVEYSVKYMNENREYVKDLFERVNDLKNKLVLKKFRFFRSEDFLKLAIDFKYTGISPYVAEKYLETKKIYCELNDGRYILFYLSPLTKLKDISYLEKYLKKLNKMKKLRNTFKENPEIKIGRKSFSYLVACEMEQVLYPLEKSEGKICGKNAGIFPPCFPIIVAGETITKETIELLKSKTNVFGITKNKINIIK